MRVPVAASLVGAFMLVTACGQPSPVDAGQAMSAARAVEKPWPALDERAAVEVASALDVVDAAYRPVIAARGLGEIEQGRLGDRLLAALESMASADPSRRGMLIAAAIDSAEGRAGWEQVCSANFEETFAALAAVADRLPLLRAACDPAKLRLLGDDGVAKMDVMGLALAVIVYGTLERHGKVSDPEIKLLKALPEDSPGFAAPVPVDMKHRGQ